MQVDVEALDYSVLNQEGELIFTTEWGAEQQQGKGTAQTCGDR
jgi:hypothetical protein